MSFCFKTVQLSCKVQFNLLILGFFYSDVLWKHPHMLLQHLYILLYFHMTPIWKIYMLIIGTRLSILLGCGIAIVYMCYGRTFEVLLTENKIQFRTSEQANFLSSVLRISKFYRQNFKCCQYKLTGLEITFHTSEKYSNDLLFNNYQMSNSVWLKDYIFNFIRVILSAKCKNNLHIPSYNNELTACKKFNLCLELLSGISLISWLILYFFNY